MMAWWRRDPTSLSRSPFHRYAQRVLRDHEAVLRTRCFSRSPSKSAKLEDDDGKRPAGISDFDWIKLQHYRRWTKRLKDDPYQAIFGASNDMLNGKGLKDWEWVYKSFPKWMLRDMDVYETSRKEEAFSNATTDKVASPKNAAPYAAATSRTVEEKDMPRKFKYARCERAFSSGISSPSDVRRPEERPYVRVVGQPPNFPSEKTPDAGETTSNLNNPPAKVDVHQRTENKENGYAQIRLNDSRMNTESIRREAAARESSFIDEFLVGNSIDENADSKRWRQTAIQRRKPVHLRTRPQTAISSLADDPVSTKASVPETIQIPSSQSSAAILGDQTSEVESQGIHTLSPMDNGTSTEPVVKDNGQSVNRASHVSDTAERPLSKRPAAEIVKQLPTEDIDFLSAADIRATMGSRRSKIPSDEVRSAERERLEQTFEGVVEHTQELDSMVEAQIINDQQIRRKKRELHEAEHEQETQGAQKTEKIVEDVNTTVPTPESSIERMKRWLETTGASFAKQFWQDPTEAEDITKSRLFFDKAYHYIRKGRTAMRPVIDDLEQDLPASVPLLRRLDKDEARLELAVHRLRQRAPTGSGQGLSPRKIKAMESLKVRYHQTNTEMEKAYATLRDIATTEAVFKTSESFRRRLTMASKVLHKNTQLSRMLIYSLQTRLEDPKIDRSVLPNYKIVADDLLSLRDTQMSLMRLVDYAILVYGASPQNAEGSKLLQSEVTNVQEFDNCEEPFIRARLASDAHLINEIKAHKSAMQGLSDDGYTRERKSVPNIVLDEGKPLTHSLFRPFTPAFEKLGAAGEESIEAQRMKEESEKKLRDTQLVADVKKAYEDAYGAITVDHVQVVPETVPLETENVAKTTSFEMLKEDPAASPLMHVSAKGAGATAERGLFSDHTEEEIPHSKPVSIQNDMSAPAKDEIITAAAPMIEDATTEEFNNQEKAALETPNDAEPVIPSASPNSNLSTHYTIVIHDPQTDNLTITTSTSGPPRDTSPALPLHQALAALESPSKFIPYITEGLEVVSAKKDMLILRDSIDETASTHAFETVPAPPPYSKIEELASRPTVNPVDGTARLSPTGYVGPEESAEQLEEEFKERRDAAGKFHGKQSNSSAESSREKSGRRKKGGAGIAKTAIWAAAFCYVAGVIGEIATSSH